MSRRGGDDTPAAVPAVGQAGPGAWPCLQLDAWQETYATLHMWTQVVGKVRLALSPPLNHWWAVAMYVSPQGLTTSAIPYGAESFEVVFDFVHQTLWIRTSSGESRAMALYARPVADFFREFMGILHSLGIDVVISPLPQEVVDPIPCDEDYEHAAYDGDAVGRWWRIMLASERVLQRFRAGFLGKASAVHFFWGGFDLAVTRFSGRRAPERPGADRVTREAYSHEVSSCGFWPGTPAGPIREPAYYAYMAPEPPGFAAAAVRPSAAHYSREANEFILPYEAVRTAADPDSALLEFAQSTYDAGATLGHWDRAALER
jgi:hypothetical protein